MAPSQELPETLTLSASVQVRGGPWVVPFPGTPYETTRKWQTESQGLLWEHQV
jgi:hypothetical protein